MREAVLFVASTAGQNPLLAYSVIYLATIFLGNISAFVGLWIIFEANFGIVGFLGLILAVFLSDMTGDLLWYSLGRSLRGTRFGLWVETHIPGHDKAETMCQKKGVRWLFLSKFVIGFAPPVIFSIGWSGLDFRTFLKNSIFSILLWLPVLVGLAYGIIVGLAPLSGGDIEKFELVAAAGLILFIALDFVVASSIRAFVNRFLKADEVRE